MINTLRLDEPRLFVVRKIFSARNATIQELANHGLAIGNNIDNDPDSSEYCWTVKQDGKRSRH